MKIPECNTNHGAYYTNEENGQWQGNGVIVDTGVGGGIVGSGDAGFHPSLYPIPHETGYVMSGPGYYPAPGYAAPPPDDFSDYMWMENEEEFDKQVMQQLEEEALMEQCIEAMLEDERRERNRSRHGGGGRAASLEQAVSRSTLNPLAAEFVPSFTRSSTDIAQEKEKPPEPAAATSKDDKPFELADSVVTLDITQNATNEVTNKQEPAPSVTTTTTTVNQTEAPTDEPPAPAVSLQATTATTDGKTDAHVKHKADARRAAKSEVVAPTAKAKSKAHSARSEPKVASSNKTEAKTSRSEEIVMEPAAEVIVAPTPAEYKYEPTTPVEEPAPSAFKPINYAAAAKANKPKKATTPPVVAEKSQTSIHQTSSVKTSAPSAKTDIRSERPTSRDKLASAPKTAKSTEKLRKNSSKHAFEWHDGGKLAYSALSVKYAYSED